MDVVQSLLCVGLDPVLEKLPLRFQTEPDPFFSFSKWIVDQTHTYVCAFKPNSAFFESAGASGIASLQKICAYIQKHHPDIPIIIDAKRGDIGHTNAHYAQFIFEYLSADAVTLQPYLGSEALSEFFAYSDKGLIILCKTSNPGAGEFQDLLVNSGEPSEQQVPLWKHIAARVATTWQQRSKADLLLVVGATYPKELQALRNQLPQTTFLVPGVGSQGGSLTETLRLGCTSNKKGLIINSSREVIYAPDPGAAIAKMWEEQR